MDSKSTLPVSPGGRLTPFFRGLSVFAVLLALSVIVRLPDLSMPLERDEGEYAYAAQEILRGRMPYTHSFCQKPPVVFLWYLAGFGIFGETVEGIHLVAALAAALTAFGIYLLSLHLLSAAESSGSGNQAGGGRGPGPSGRAGAWIAALAFTFYSAGSGYFGSAANTEIFMLVPVVFGALWALKAAESEKPSAWFLTGLFFGAAFMTKQVALFSFIGPGIFAAWKLWSRRSPPLSHVWPLLFGGAGALAAMGALAAWLAAAGALGHFLEASFGYNLSYVGSPFGAWKWEQMAETFSDRFLVTDGLLWFCMALCPLLILAARSARRNRALWFALLWFIPSLFGVALGPMTLGHYFLQVLPPLVLAAGAICALGVRCVTGTPSRARAVAAALGAAVLVLPVVDRIQLPGLPVEKRSFELYSTYSKDPPFIAAAEIGEYLRETTAPQDRILVVGSEPEILFHARRRSATRFTIFYPFTGNFAGADAMVEEFFREIRQHPPRKVVLAREGVFFITGRESPEQWGRIQSRIARFLSSMKAFLSENYTEEFLIFSGASLDGFPGHASGSGWEVIWKRMDGISPAYPRPLFVVYNRRE